MEREVEDEDRRTKLLYKAEEITLKVIRKLTVHGKVSGVRKYFQSQSLMKNTLS
jgi:hypothetical protein